MEMSRPSRIGQRPRVQPDFSKMDDQTKQSFKDDTDINLIVKKHGINAIKATAEALNDGYYGDFSGVGSYADAVLETQRCEDQFNRLPAETRAAFNNNAGQLLRFVEDPANHQAGIDMGIFPGERTVPTPPIPPGENVNDPQPAADREPENPTPPVEPEE